MSKPAASVLLLVVGILVALAAAFEASAGVLDSFKLLSLSVVLVAFGALLR